MARLDVALAIWLARPCTRSTLGMLRVMIESPFAGDRKPNDAYLARATRDSLGSGKAPFAHHGTIGNDWTTSALSRVGWASPAGSQHVERYGGRLLLNCRIEKLAAESLAALHELVPGLAATATWAADPSTPSTRPRHLSGKKVSDTLVKAAGRAACGRRFRMPLDRVTVVACPRARSKAFRVHSTRHRHLESLGRRRPNRRFESAAGLHDPDAPHGKDAVLLVRLGLCRLRRTWAGTRLHLPL